MTVTQASTRAEETIARQCEVIKELDAERLALRTSSEVVAQEQRRLAQVTIM